MANCVVTEARPLTEKTEPVKRFLAALLAGWQQALDRKNQEEAIKTLQKYDPDTPRPVLKEQLINACFCPRSS